jgi:hypothetical protein
VCSDRFRRELQRRALRLGAGEAIEGDEAVAGQRAFGRGVAELAAKRGDQALFAFVLGAQRDVAAFRRDRQRARAGEDQAADSKARARAEQSDRCTGHRRARADGFELVGSTTSALPAPAR